MIRAINSAAATANAASFIQGDGSGEDGAFSQLLDGQLGVMAALTDSPFSALASEGLPALTGLAKEWQPETGPQREPSPTDAQWLASQWQVANAVLPAMAAKDAPMPARLAADEAEIAVRTDALASTSQHLAAAEMSAIASGDPSRLSRKQALQEDTETTPAATKSDATPQGHAFGFVARQAMEQADQKVAPLVHAAIAEAKAARANEGGRGAGEVPVTGAGSKSLSVSMAVAETAGKAVASLLPSSQVVTRVATSGQSQLQPDVRAGGTSILPDDVRLMFRVPTDAKDVPSTPVTTGDAAQVGAAHWLQSVHGGARGATPGVPTQTLQHSMVTQPDAWREEFAQKMQSLVNFKVDSASIQVSPENMGPLDISIRFDQQDVAAISVVASSEKSRDLIESGLHQLGKMLEQSGVQVGKFEVTTQSANMARQDQSAQQQAWQQQHGGQSRHRQPDAPPQGFSLDPASPGITERLQSAIQHTSGRGDQLSILA